MPPCHRRHAVMPPCRHAAMPPCRHRHAAMPPCRRRHAAATTATAVPPGIQHHHTHTLAPYLLSPFCVQVRVCADDPGLFLGNSQASVFKSITTYLGQGPMLATLCCVVWFLAVIKDVGAALQLIIAVTKLCGPTTKLKGRRIEMLSIARVVWFCMVQMSRIAVAICLAYGVQNTHIGCPHPHLYHCR